MKILIYILILFSLQAQGQQTIFKMSKFARIKFSHSLPLPPEDTEDPSTPTLSFVSKTSTTISVSWTTSTDNVGVTGYDIYLDAVLYDNEVGTSTVITGLTQNTEYDINVRAKDASGNESANSNTITRTTDDSQAPTAPTLAFVSKTTTSISVSWSGATDNVAVTSYDVYKDNVFYSNETGTSKNVIGLTPSTEYDIHVKAKDAAGNQSVNSNTITQTTDDPDIAASGTEIFRIVTTNPSGWEWREDSTDDWEAMQNFNGTGTGNITVSGGTYRGYVFTNSTGHCLTSSNVTNVTIEYCIFKQSNAVGFRPVGGNNLTIQKCLFTDVVMGIFVFDQTGNLKIKNNWGLNFQWDRTAPIPGTFRNGQFIHTANVTGSGNEILDNRIENVFGRSYNEDCINLYNGHGTSASHFKVRKNLIRGGGTSGTGGGILAGDACGTYNDLDSNRLVHPGWYGVQIFGGSNNRAINNYVFSEPQMPWNSVGYLIYDGGCSCTNATMNTTNVSRYRRSAVLYGGNIYNFEDGGGCTPGGTFSVTSSTTLTEANMPMPDGSTGFPTRLIDCVSEDDYYKLINSDWRASALINSFGVTGPLNNAPDVNPRRPTASVSGGAVINITTTSTTLTNNSLISSGGAGTFTLTAHSWTHVSGPNTPTIVSPTGTSTSITGLAHGTHLIRYTVEQNNSVYNLKTYTSYWVRINVDLS